MVDVDEGRALEEDALAVGLTTIRGGWVLVDDVMAAVDEATAADELGAALLDADAGFFDVEVEAAFLVVVDSGFLEVDSDFLVVVSAFSNFWANNNNINNENLFWSYFVATHFTFSSFIHVPNEWSCFC